MIAYLTSYLQSLVGFSLDLLPWLLVGFIVAGLVEEFVPIRHFLRYFGKNSWKSILRASSVGMFVSLCSCGAIPLAVTMRRKGATTANALTFLLASPWVGPIQLLIIYKFLGLELTGLFFVFSLLVAILSGSVLARLESGDMIERDVGSRAVLTNGACVEETLHAREPLRKRVLVCSLRNSWSVFREVGKYLVFGVLIAAALMAFVPNESIVGVFGSQSWYSILLTVPVSAVLELCSEGLSILGGQLFLMGASAGVVFTMMLVGVTTDFTELSVIWGRFGKRSAVAYLLISTVLAVVFAYFVNLIWYYL